MPVLQQTPKLLLVEMDGIRFSAHSVSMTDAKRGANSASVALAFLDAGFTLCQAYPVRGLDLAGHVLVPGLRTLARAKKIVQIP